MRRHARMPSICDRTWTGQRFPEHGKTQKSSMSEMWAHYFSWSNIQPYPSMWLVYFSHLPKKSTIHLGKYTVRPMDGIRIVFFLGEGGSQTTWGCKQSKARWSWTPKAGGQTDSFPGWLVVDCINSCVPKNHIFSYVFFFNWCSEIW